MGTTPVVATRKVTVAGYAMTEVCAIIDRAGGGVTHTDGTHVPLPDERGLLRGYVASVNGLDVAAFYLIPRVHLATSEPTFAAILDTLTIRELR